jgi:hypothetical protein
MFGSYYAEFALGLMLLAVAAGLWVLLLRLFRRPAGPGPFRGEMAAQISTIFEIALLAFGLTTIFDAAVHMIP